MMEILVGLPVLALVMVLFWSVGGIVNRYEHTGNGIVDRIGAGFMFTALAVISALLVGLISWALGHRLLGGRF